MANLSFAVTSDTRVIADVFVPYAGYPELGAVVENTSRRRRIDRMLVFEPNDLRSRRTIGLAIQYNRVAQIHVNYLLRRDHESRRCCKNKTNLAFNIDHVFAPQLTGSCTRLFPSISRKLSGEIKKKKLRCRALFLLHTGGNPKYLSKFRRPPLRAANAIGIY